MSEQLTRPSPHFKRYLAAALPLNCLGADSIKPSSGTGVGYYAGEPCREIRAEGAGTVTVKRASDGASQTITMTDGEYKTVMCSEITSTTCTAVEVFW